MGNRSQLRMDLPEVTEQRDGRDRRALEMCDAFWAL
jgi:hypothetical protein